MVNIDCCLDHILCETIHHVQRIGNNNYLVLYPFERESQSTVLLSTRLQKVKVNPSNIGIMCAQNGNTPAVLELALQIYNSINSSPPWEAPILYAVKMSLSRGT